MSEVVDLAAKREERRLIWSCHCGCTSFKCFADGGLECVNCSSQFQDTGEWRRELPEPPAKAKDLSSDNFQIALVEDFPDWLRRAPMRAEQHEGVSAAVLCFKDGNVSTWFPGITNAERLKWFRNKLKVAYDTVARCIK